MESQNSRQKSLLTFYTIPNPWYFSALLILFIITSLVYLVWMFGFAVDWRVWFTGFVFAAELYRISFSILSLVCLRKFQYAEFRNPEKKSTVDALIPTLNEPVSIVEATARGALAMVGVRDVLILDDGDRPHIRELAERLGAKYFARRSSAHAKAGNMNFGLEHTDAQFVVTLDADHIPLPEFIQRTLGYFTDPHLAFVQTPQVFYNLTSIQHRPTKDYPDWSEQTMFYESIQPAKNAFNAAFFCGSSAVLRRSALDSVGGFATGTATEDIHTSIRLHSKKWKSLFVNEKLAFGLAPEDLKEYHKQRVRWGAGSLGLLLRTKDSPLIIRGLTPMQRLGYLNSTLGYAQGYTKLFFYLLPIYIIFTHTSPFTVPFTLFLVLYLPYMATSFWITRIYSRDTYHPLFTEQYNIANIFSNVVALKGIIRIEKKFPVSIKIKTEKENSFVLLILIMIGVAMLFAQSYGIAYWIIFLHANVHRLLDNSLIIGLFWNLINLLIFASFLKFILTYNTQGKSEQASSRGVSLTSSGILSV